MPRPKGFAATLHWWRQRRGWSQLDLAERAEISQRHLSFLELGRASPSRDMVVRLAAALDLPLRQQNALLLAAGFAPIWRETELSAPELAQVRTALDHIMRQQEPFPAVAVDRHWNTLKANNGMTRLTEFLVGPLPPDARVNLADALVAPDVLRPFLVNWEDVVRYFIRSVEADAATDGNPETAKLFERLLAYRDVRGVLKKFAVDTGGTPVLPMHFRKDDVSLQLFTTIATLGLHKMLRRKNCVSNPFSQWMTTRREHYALGLRHRRVLERHRDVSCGSKPVVLRSSTRFPLRPQKPTCAR
jgi:transcriptional regulator with XRE-family HTH domain